ncbi:hypothetical protein ACTFIY_004083 [Dictyostelium cf. discoideum]
MVMLVLYQLFCVKNSPIVPPISSSSSSSLNHFSDGHFCFISHDINNFEFRKNKNLLTFANYFASNSKYRDEKLDYEQLFVFITDDQPSSQLLISFETLRDFAISSMKFKRKNLFFTRASIRNTKYTNHYLKFIDWMFNNYNQENENAYDTQKKTIKNMVESFMNLIIHKSKLQVLEIIHQNFDFILKKESNEFERNSNEHSLLFFSNKFNK